MTGLPRASRQDGTYPRPQLVRPAHRPLDVEVGFAHDDHDAGLEAHWETDPTPFDRTIRLPFAPEAAASGIGDAGYHPCVWYRIVLGPEDLAAAGHAPGRRLLLWFGAVDHEATVFVDGRLVGHHRGGQTAFSLDITAALADGPGHVVVVRAFDDPLEAGVPRGKQDWRPRPHSIWYERTTGIWRTVWLESVPALHVARLGWRFDAARRRVVAEVELNRRPSRAATVTVELAHDGVLLARATRVAVERVLQVEVRLDGPRAPDLEMFLWSPGRPVLLDAEVRLAGPGEPDAVASYLGLREVTTRAGSLAINGRPTFLRGVLEQGYWPASGFTAPDSGALRAEVELILALGFNLARVHQKVEDPRFHYWADRLGLLLWAETAAAYRFDTAAVADLTAEWEESVRSRSSHPSIVAWVPFNESWGIPQVARDPAQQAFSRGLADLTRALDPTRPVVSNDGWEHTDSDLLTVHDYEAEPAVLRTRYAPAGLAALLAGAAGPAGPPLVAGDRQREGAPVVVSEFGGVAFEPSPVAGGWGYSAAGGAADYEQRVAGILGAFEGAAVAGFCWTQLTDTLQEVNGLCDGERRPKLPAASIRRLVTGVSPAAGAPSPCDGGRPDPAPAG